MTLSKNVIRGRSSSSSSALPTYNPTSTTSITSIAPFSAFAISPFTVRSLVPFANASSSHSPTKTVPNVGLD